MVFRATEFNQSIGGFVIDGSRFCDYAGFVEELNRGYLGVFGGPRWDGDDFDDLDEMLELSKTRISITWVRSKKSLSDLGYGQMAEFWQRRIDQARALGIYLLPGIQESADNARAARGATLFDWLVEQLSHDNVDLKLVD